MSPSKDSSVHDVIELSLLRSLKRNENSESCSNLKQESSCYAKLP